MHTTILVSEAVMAFFEHFDHGLFVAPGIKQENAHRLAPPPQIVKRKLIIAAANKKARLSLEPGLFV